MQHDFWHDKWNQNDIGFDQPEANPLLVSHFSSLQLKPGATVFVPLCGKSIDMVWLVQQGFQVVGIELSEDAIQRFFQDIQVKPEVTEVSDFIRYQAPNLAIYVGDFFALSADLLGAVDASYDRAALVALPEAMRVDYCQHLIAITQKAQQLLITFDYDQSLQAGPPFAIPEPEIRRHYDGAYGIKKLASIPVRGGLKGGCEAWEQVWHLATK